MARIAGVNIPTNKRVVIALQYIHGIGASKAREITDKVGIPAERPRAVLETDEFGDAVRADIDEARDLGINGVPFFVVDRRFVISGAQPAELFSRARTMAASQATPTA